jgi:thiamine biosynthesis lipoprotein
VRLTDRLPYIAAFPDALGTGLLLHTDAPLADGLHDRLGAFIDTYERTLSRFRDDSTVSRMRTAARGGVFDFPDWASGLFDLYDALYSGTDGAIDPCVGEDLIRLGYDAVYSFTVEPAAGVWAPSTAGPPGAATWSDMAPHWSPGVPSHWISARAAKDICWTCSRGCCAATGGERASRRTMTANTSSTPGVIC